VGLVLGLLALGVVGWHAANPFVERRIKGDLLAQLSRALGRPVTSGDAELSLYPAGIRIQRVHVAGEGADPPLLTARELVVRPELFRLLASLGRDVRISKVVLMEPSLTLVRREDGTWSLPRPEQGPEVPGTKGKGAAPSVVIHRVELARGQMMVLDRSLGRQDVVFSELELTAKDVGVGVPIAIKLRASQPEGEGRLRAKLTFSPRSPGADGAFAWPEARGTLEAHQWKLEPFTTWLPKGLRRLATEATLDLETKVGTRDGAYTVDGKLALADIELKGADTGTRFSVKGSVDPRRPDSSWFELSDFRLKLPGVDVSGELTVLGFTRARIALSGPLLDLGELTAPRKRPNPDGKPRPKRNGWAPLATRELLRRFQISGSIHLDRLRFHRVDFGQVHTTVDFSEATLRLRRGTASFYGGRLDAQGSWLDLGQAQPDWKFVGRLNGVDSGVALQDLIGKQPVRGPLDALFSLKGKGFRWRSIREGLRGGGSVSMVRGQLAPIQLEKRLSGFLKKRLEPASRLLAQGTAFADGDATFRIRDGWLAAEQPVSMRTPFGQFLALGRVGLDGQLDFNGMVRVRPQFAAQVLGKGLGPRNPVEVPLRFRGTLNKPAIRTEPWAVAGSLLAGGTRQPSDLKAPEEEDDEPGARARRRPPER
jgi:uncharacterized protein involved in outer membrane biogenesis